MLFFFKKIWYWFLSFIFVFIQFIFVMFYHAYIMGIFGIKWKKHKSYPQKSPFSTPIRIYKLCISQYRRSTTVDKTVVIFSGLTVLLNFNISPPNVTHPRVSPILWIIQWTLYLASRHSLLVYCDYAKIITFMLWSSFWIESWVWLSSELSLELSDKCFVRPC